MVLPRARLAQVRSGKRKVRNFVATTAPSDTNRIYFTEGTVLNNTNKGAYEALGETAAQKVKPEVREKAAAWMCEHYYDVRTFGAVMATEVNCGQVRGPVQVGFARSIDPVVTSEHAITRSSVTNEKDAEKERTMGRKFTIPFGLYMAHGSVNPFLAKRTGFTESDLDLFFKALENAFEFDHSAARPPGSMNPRKLIIFKHDSQLGKAHSHKLFEAVTVSKKAGVETPRSFDDYEVSIDRAKIPQGVEIIERL